MSCREQGEVACDVRTLLTGDDLDRVTTGVAKTQGQFVQLCARHPIFGRMCQHGRADGVALQGTLTYYAVTAESGNKVERGFCPTCGSPVCIRAELVPDLIGLWAGSLDQPSRFMPQIDVWTASATAWDTMPDNLPKVRHAPTAEQLQKLLS